MIQEHIKKLFKYDRQLLGKGYDQALKYINSVLPLDVIEVPSGTKLGTWTVPNEWVVKDAWVKYKGKKIIDYKNNPLHLLQYSAPFKGTVDVKELEQHLYYSSDINAIPYEYSFYTPKWGFCVRESDVFDVKCKNGICTPELKKIDPSVGKVKIEGVEDEKEKKLKKGKYEVFIDTELKPGKLKIGVHTVKGKSDREILLFAHLDHPWQANDNLSGVAALMDMAERLKGQFKHTIKIIFCPETIGSIAYGETQDISKVDFVIALDCVGNDNRMLIQKAYNAYDRINYAVHLAVQSLGISFDKSIFRLNIGSDEYFYNDPLVGIPGIMLSRYPYKEYHTSSDTPAIIKEDKIKETEALVLKTIEIYENDYIPKRNFRGVLFRTAYGIQTSHKLTNMDLDYLMFDIDGKKYLTQILMNPEGQSGLLWDYAYGVLEKLKKHKLIS